jgi:hypothetical protein
VINPEQFAAEYPGACDAGPDCGKLCAEVAAAPSNSESERTAKLARMPNSFESRPVGAVRELCLAKLTGA